MKRARNEIYDKTKKTCLIIGQDGWDLDVLINLTFFYNELGFRVTIAREPMPTDLLVIQRFCPNGNISTHMLSPNKPIHIFPYVGYSPEPLLRHLNKFPVSIFAPSENLMAKNGFVYQTVMFPPVYVPFWKRKIRSSRYKFVHIGNLKKIENNSIWPEWSELVQGLQAKNAHVWGKGWGKYNVATWHGKLLLSKVPHIYAQTKYALGLMYPYQVRMKTISGRFWQAPLCGAAVICEKNINVQIPGIFPIGFSCLNNDNLLKNLIPDRYDIQLAATEFWENQWNDCKKKVRESLLRAPALEGHSLPIASAIFAFILLIKEGIIYA